MTETLKAKIARLRGSRSLKEFAADVGVDYPSFRKYACGKRTPRKLGMAELDRRMQSQS